MMKIRMTMTNEVRDIVSCLRVASSSSGDYKGAKKIERSGSSDTSYLVFVDRSCDKHVIQSRKSGLRNIHTLHILLLPPQRGFSGTYNTQR